MRTDHDLERAVRLWVAQGSEQLPEPALDAALDQIAETEQRQAGWLARRFNLMNGNALKFGAAAVAILAVAILGVRFLPGAVGGPSDPTPTPSPNPSPTLVAGALASGSFTASLGEFGQAFEIEATGTGDDVSGTLDVSGAGGAYSVDLQCARTTDSGKLIIAGEVGESTSEFIVDGVYVAMMLTPEGTFWWADVLPDDEVPAPADSCSGWLDTIFSDPELPGIEDVLRPITGDLELGQ
jgi:hypothetical protein